MPRRFLAHASQSPFATACRTITDAIADHGDVRASRPAPAPSRLALRRQPGVHFLGVCVIRDRTGRPLLSRLHDHSPEPCPQVRARLVEPEPAGDLIDHPLCRLPRLLMPRLADSSAHAGSRQLPSRFRRIQPSITLAWLQTSHGTSHGTLGCACELRPAGEPCSECRRRPSAPGRRRFKAR